MIYVQFCNNASSSILNQFQSPIPSENRILAPNNRDLVLSNFFISALLLFSKHQQQQFTYETSNVIRESREKAKPGVSRPQQSDKVPSKQTCQVSETGFASLLKSCGVLSSQPANCRLHFK